MRVNINQDDIKNISLMQLNTFWTLTVKTKDGALVDFTLNQNHIDYLVEEVATQNKIRDIMEAFKTKA